MPMSRSDRDLKVFVSSTSEDLREYRAVARLVILDMGWTPVMMEHFGPMPTTTVEACIERLKECDLMVLMVAFKRGYVPTLDKGGNGRDSITGLELDYARQHSIPVLAMLASETWPGNEWEDDADAREWIKKFRCEINLPADFFDYESPTAEESKRLPAFRAKLGSALVSYRERLLRKRDPAKSTIPTLSREVEALLVIGDRFAENYDYDQAIEQYERARQIDNKNTQVLLRLVETVRKKYWTFLWATCGDILTRGNEPPKDVKQALVLLYEAQVIDPTLRLNPKWIAEESYLRRMSSYPGAVRSLEKALKDLPGEPAILGELGNILVRRFSRERREEGLQMLRNAVSKRPEEPAYLYYLAEALEDDRDDERIREYYRAAQLASDKKDWTQWFHGGGLNAASRIINRWHTSKPDGVLNRASTIPLAERIRLIEECELADGCSDVERTLTILYYASGQIEKAEETLERTFPPAFARPLDWVEQQFTPEYGLLTQQIGAGKLAVLQTLLGKDPLLGGVVAHPEPGETSPPRVIKISGSGLLKGAGFEEGDIIASVNGTETPTLRSFVHTLQGLPTGSNVTFGIERGGQSLTLRGVIR